LANLYFLGACVLLLAYVRRRYGSDPSQLANYALLALCLYPFGFFFRLAYSESLFLVTCLAVFHLMEKKRPLLVTALATGFATAVRPVGVALLAPLTVYIWQQTPSWKSFVRRFVVVMPIACWGITAFVVYQQIQFGEPLAFVKTQAHWGGRHNLPPLEKLEALVTLKPVWEICCADPSPLVDRDGLFDAGVANRLFFLLAWCLMFVGMIRRWLSLREVLLVLGLLLIPYVSHLNEVNMAAAARYASVAFPLYLVAGQLLCRLPTHLAAACLSLGGFLLGAYAALFLAWYPVF
jgi:hypothetical protein